jgi:ketosteroid isomerase-like protein
MRRQIVVIVAIALTALLAVKATASDETEIVAMINKWNDDFNRRDESAMNAPCSSETVIVDAIPPHAWHGPNACSEWWKDFRAFNVKTGSTDGVQSIDRPRSVLVMGDRAYVVAPAQYVDIENGKSVTNPGIFTFALHKLGGVWHIAGWVWTEMSERGPSSSQ